MSSSLLTIESAKSKSFKELAKTALGHVFNAFFNARANELSNLPTSYPKTLKDKLLMAYLKEQARVANDTAFFERLHADFWRGPGGDVFSRNCDHRFDDLFLTRQAYDIEMLKHHWSSSDCRHIVEIGCCSGMHLQYLTTQLPGVVSAVGIDINPTQIQSNLCNPKFDSRIDFIAADGGQWIANHAKPNTLFVTNGGVLEYFSRQRICEIFGHISTKLAPAMLFTVEPVAADHDATATNESVPFGEELSFSHNYLDLFESSGFRVLHQRPVDYENWRMMTTIAST